MERWRESLEPFEPETYLIIWHGHCQKCGGPGSGEFVFTPETTHAWTMCPECLSESLGYQQAELLGEEN